MKSTVHNIERLYKVIDSSVFTVTGTLDYDRVTDAIIELANAVHSYDFDPDSDGYEIWDIGEFGACSLSEFIVGAYWHYSEWHAGQWSNGYAALSALGQVFSPGMSSSEDDNEAYTGLNAMAELNSELSQA